MREREREGGVRDTGENDIPALEREREKEGGGGGVVGCCAIGGEESCRTGR